MQLKNLQQMIQKIDVKKFFYFIAIVVVLYVAYKILTYESKMPAEIRATLDSLNRVNATLVEKQKQIDSTIASNQSKIDEVDNQIKNIKEKTTIIKEYYHEISNKVTHYDAIQIDSFFKSRYNY